MITLIHVEEGYVLVLYIIIIVIKMVSKIIRVVARFPPVGCLMPAANKVSSVIYWVDLDLIAARPTWEIKSTVLVYYICKLT